MAGAFKSNHARFPQALVFAVSAVIAVSTITADASAQVLGYAPPSSALFSTDDAIANPSLRSGAIEKENAESPSTLSEGLRRAVVAYNTREAPGTIVIDTGHTALYYVLGANRAIRYGVGVGREGFTWSGVQTISRKAEWPDWHPPAEMIARQPYLPRFMAGGPGNPLGARAMYLGSSKYRIHGTNDPTTIGKFVSSGCIRLTNEDVEDLFSRVQIGARVVVLPKREARLEARVNSAKTAASGHPVSSSPSRTITPRTVASVPKRQALNLTTAGLY